MTDDAKNNTEHNAGASSQPDGPSAHPDAAAHGSQHEPAPAADHEGAAPGSSAASAPAPASPEPGLNEKSNRNLQKPASVNTAAANGNGDGPKREASAAGAETPTKIKRRKGFWASFVAVCVPCIAPSDAHDTAPDAAGRKAHQQVPSEVSSVDADLKDKEKHRRSSVLPQDASISTTLDAANVNGPGADEAAVVARDPTPEPSDVEMDGEADVVVPPHPSHHTLPESETGGVTAGAVQAPGQTETDIADEMDDEEDRLILQGGMGIPIGPDGEPMPLLPPLAAHHSGRKCLVLDLDETLVHSSFKMIPQADYIIPVLIEHQLHNVYVVKRPGVDTFLEKMGELYEVVVFTASLSMYADPVLDKLDIHRAVSHRLFREHCYNHKGVYVKDLSQLGRPIEGTIILDNSPASYIFHPNNAVPVSSWFSDPHDTELTDMCPFLDDLRSVDDVRGVLDGGL